MNQALQESTAARENMCVCLVAGVCETFPVQVTMLAHCCGCSWTTPGAGSAHLALKDDQEQRRPEVTAVTPAHSGSCRAGVVSLATCGWFGTVGISAGKEHRAASRIMPMVSQMRTANCCPASLRCCKKHISRCRSCMANVHVLGVLFLL